MNDVFSRYLDGFFLVFLNEISVSSCRAEAYIADLWKDLRKHRSYAKALEYGLIVQEIEILGQ